MNIEQLNQQFGLPRQLSFSVEPDSGLIVADLAQGQARLCLQGAHLMSWHPKGQAQPVIWLSRAAKLAVGKSIRGGAPVCWPWFGARGADVPAHGYARTVPWQVVESGLTDEGSVSLTLRWAQDSHPAWPHAAVVELTVVVGSSLNLSLTTRNSGDTAFELSEALHTYFHISDIGAVRLHGLDGAEYWDKVGGRTERCRQEGLLTFAAETDRVYIHSAATCVLEDPGLKRRIVVEKSGSLSTVVWTPWLDKAQRMGDLGEPDGWREMLCIESGNALDNTLNLLPGQSHSLRVHYQVA